MTGSVDGNPAADKRLVDKMPCLKYTKQDIQLRPRSPPNRVVDCSRTRAKYWSVVGSKPKIVEPTAYLNPSMPFALQFKVTRTYNYRKEREIYLKLP